MHSKKNVMVILSSEFEKFFNSWSLWKKLDVTVQQLHSLEPEKNIEHKKISKLEDMINMML